MITMRWYDRPREPVRNCTFLSASAWTVDSTTMQPTGCLKGQLAQGLSDSLPVGGKLKA